MDQTDITKDIKKIMAESNLNSQKSISNRLNEIQAKGLDPGTTFQSILENNMKKSDYKRPKNEKRYILGKVAEEKIKYD